MNTQARPARPATYQDILDAPPHMVAEIAGGRLHLHPRPASRHARASFRMAGQLDGPFQGGPAAPAAGTSPSSPSSTSAPTSSSPTSPAGAASACRSSPTPPPSTSPPTGSAEILSPGTRRFDLTEKRELYRRNAVAHLWLVDPDARTLEAFTLLAGAWTLAAAFQDGDDIRAAPFEALAFPLGRSGRMTPRLATPFPLCAAYVRGTPEIFLAAPPGLEPLLRDEAAALGLPEPKAVPGGVVLAGGWPEVWRANLHLRGATRVLARIAAFRALHLAQLDKRARKVAWGETLRADVPLRVEVTTRASRIWHAGAARERIAAAIRDGLGRARWRRSRTRVRWCVRVRIDDDLCTVSVDTSGEPLHRRGHKQEVNAAPMRETLAALFLRAAGYGGGEPVVDPMCGSGTFVIEAAEIAMGLAPGRSRAFAFERLAGFDAAAWAALRGEVSAAGDGLPLPGQRPRRRGGRHEPGQRGPRRGGRGRELRRAPDRRAGAAGGAGRARDRQSALRDAAGRRGEPAAALCGLRRGDEGAASGAGGSPW